MDIVERIRQLCARNDISIAALERQLNFGNGTIGRWSTASPTVERLGKVADYFGVSVDYLTGREQQETLEAFIRLPRCGRLGKMGLIVKYGFTKNTLVRTLGQMLFIGD